MTTAHHEFYLNAVKQSEKSKWETQFAQQLKENGIEFQAQYRFHPERMWRLDFAILPATEKISVEIQGGTFGRVVQCNRCHLNVTRMLKDGRHVPVREGGRHNTGTGMEADAEKHNAMVYLGWRPLTFTSKHIRDGYAINLILKMLKR